MSSMAKLKFRTEEDKRILEHQKRLDGLEYACGEAMNQVRKSL